MRDKGSHIATFVRLPLYRNYLRSLSPRPEHISASSIASALAFGEVQVRKDLAYVCGGGRPRVGYVTEDLLSRLEDVLGRRGAGEAVLVGAGKIGRALLDYGGFSGYGVDIVAGFDTDTRALGLTPGGKSVMEISELEPFCKKRKIRLGVISVPASHAQEACDLLVAAGVRAIWCFAPTRLSIPDGVIIRYENLAASLAVLAARLDDLSPVR